MWVNNYVHALYICTAYLCRILVHGKCSCYKKCISSYLSYLFQTCTYTGTKFDYLVSANGSSNIKYSEQFVAHYSIPPSRSNETFSDFQIDKLRRSHADNTAVGTLCIRNPAYVIMMVTDVLLSYWCEANSNHHAHSNLTLSHESNIHDDVIKWKHFPRYWSFVHRSPVNSLHKHQWRGTFFLSSAPE